MVVRVGYRAKVARKSAEPLIEMTQRRRLDLHLAEQAAAAGAEFRDGVAVSDVELGDAGVTARVGSHLVGARFLVGADGANGVVARSAGLGEGIVRGSRSRATLPGARSNAPRTPERPGSSSASCPAATAGCFRRAIMRTSE